MMGSQEGPVAETGLGSWRDLEGPDMEKVRHEFGHRSSAVSPQWHCTHGELRVATKLAK